MPDDDDSLPGSPPKVPPHTPKGFEPEPSSPPMEAPELERLHMKPEAIVTGPIASYVSREELPDGDTPFLRDTPFGEIGFGGETPFFMGSDNPGYDFETSDTDGIPTGLPDLIDLPPAPDNIPVDSDDTPAGVPRVVYVSAKPLDPKKQRQDRLVWFSVGVLVTSLLWAILLYLFSLQAQ